MNTKAQQTFPLGRIVATANALGVISPEEMTKALDRHAAGDWGDISPVDWRLNQMALEDGDRLLSVYYDEDGVKFWVLTEADRSATTVLLPEDY